MEISTSIKKYNVIVIDECVGGLLKEDLIDNEIPAIVISISENPNMKGMRDDYVLDFCNYYNAALVTNDRGIFERYQGYKIFKWITEDEVIIKKLIRYFSNKKSNLSIDDYIRINNNL